MRTDGQRALLKVLQSNTQAEVAEEVGVSQQTVSMWASGAFRPTDLQRLRLQVVYGIDRDSWMTSAERRAAFGDRAAS
jgi:transcriptional regulator with XRE-family HTH domain